MVDSVERHLAHYGVKGMRWGVRRSEEERRAPSNVNVNSKSSRKGAQDITVKARPSRGVVSTKGGKRNVASDDAIKTRASRQKAKKSTTDALSNKELQETINRMQMEKKYRDLQKSEPKIKKAKDYLKEFLTSEGPKILGSLAKGG